MYPWFIKQKNKFIKTHESRLLHNNNYDLIFICLFVFYMYYFFIFFYNTYTCVYVTGFRSCCINCCIMAVDDSFVNRRRRWLPTREVLSITYCRLTVLKYHRRRRRYPIWPLEKPHYLLSIIIYKITAV